MPCPSVLSWKYAAMARCSARLTAAGCLKARWLWLATRRKRGTKITFFPDGEIFETTEFSYDVLSQRLREMAFLNAGGTDQDYRRTGREGP